MDQNNNSSFFESKTLIAILLMGMIWFGWQAYLNQKYPKPKGENPGPATPVAEQTAEEKPGNPGETGDQSAVKEALNELEDAADVQTSARPEQLIEVESGNLNFQISSYGMGLKHVELNEYTDRDGEKVVLGRQGELPLFGTQIVDQEEPLDFQINEVEPNHYVGVAQVGDVTITKTMVFDPSKYRIDITTNITSSNRVPAISYSIGENIQEIESGSFFMPSFGHQEAVVLYNGGEEERIDISALEEKYSQSFERVAMASVGSQYFTSSIVDESVISPELALLALPEEKNILATLVYNPTSSLKELEIKMTAYAGPKSLPALEAVDERLAETINYGMFSVIARPLLRVLRFWYDIVGNWGVAIILLTLLVRLVVLPFNLMSFKSMKTMQQIQPQIKALRERYKEDPQKLNQEMMTLMRENKANPLGGCLPMLLQFPIFLALYQVLGQSIELYQAPFILWINDLSLKDPYYVLPVLMGVSMFVQQKIQPTTMDPAQAKVMMIMPVVFALFMVALPSGLTLYIFTTTLFGIIQQFIFLRDKNSSTSPREAKA